jgi:hypothetical protein
MESRLDRSQTLLQLPALDLTAHESGPKPEHGVCHLQRQRSVRAAAVLACDEPLEVTQPVRPTDLPGAKTPMPVDLIPIAGQRPARTRLKQPLKRRT